MLPEPCGRCGGQRYLEEDPEFGWHAQKCFQCGRITAYVSADGDVTEAGVVTGERPRLSTREWVADVIGPTFLQEIEALDEGTYGAWE